MGTPGHRKFSMLVPLAAAVAAILTFTQNAQAVVADCESASSAPACDGECPETSTGAPQFCFSFSGTCLCFTDMPCGTVGAPNCYGECPVGEACVDIGGGSCQCQSVVPGCSSAGYPECDGTCLLGFQCKDDGAGGCGCGVANQPCGSVQGPPDICTGECPPGMTCFDISGTCTCSTGIVTPIVSPMGGVLLTVLLGLSLSLGWRRVPRRT